MVISSNFLTTSLDIMAKSPNKKQKSRISITDIANQDFRNFLMDFNSSPYVCSKKKRFYNEPIEAYFFPIIYVSKLIKIQKHMWLCTKGVKLENGWTRRVNENIWHVNRKIQSGIT